MSRTSISNIPPELTQENLDSVYLILAEIFNRRYSNITDFNADADQYLNWVRQTLGDKDFIEIYRSVISERGDNPPTIGHLKDELLKVNYNVWSIFQQRQPGEKPSSIQERLELFELHEAEKEKLEQEYSQAHPKLTQTDVEKHLATFQARNQQIRAAGKYAPQIESESVSIPQQSEIPSKFQHSLDRFAHQTGIKLSPSDVSHLYDVVEHRKDVPPEELIVETASILNHATFLNKTPQKINVVTAAADFLGVPPPTTAQRQSWFGVATLISPLDIPLAEKVSLANELSNLKPAPVGILTQKVQEIFDITQAPVSPEIVTSIAQKVSVLPPADINFAASANKLIQEISLLSPSLSPNPIITFPNLRPPTPQEQPVFVTETAPPLASSPLITTGLAVAALQSAPNFSPKNLPTATEVIKQVLTDNPSATAVEIQNAFTKKGLPELESVRAAVRIQAAVATAAPFAAANALAVADATTLNLAETTFKFPDTQVQAIRQTVKDTLSQGETSLPVLQQRLVDQNHLPPAQAAVISKQSIDRLKLAASEGTVLVTPAPAGATPVSTPLSPLASSPLITTGLAFAALSQVPNLAPKTVASATEVIKDYLHDNPGQVTAAGLQNVLTTKAHLSEIEAIRATSTVQVALVTASPFAAANALAAADEIARATSDTFKLAPAKAQSVRQVVKDALSQGETTIPALQKKLVEETGISTTQAAVISKQSLDALKLTASAGTVLVTPPAVTQIQDRVTRVAATLAHSQPVEFTPDTLSRITQTLSDPTISVAQKHAQIIKDVSPHLSPSTVPITPSDTAKLFLQGVGLYDLPKNPQDNLRFITTLHLYHEVPSDKIDIITQKITSLPNQPPEIMVEKIKGIIKEQAPSNLSPETYTNLAFAKTASPTQLETLVSFYQQVPFQADVAGISAKNPAAFASLSLAITAAISPPNVSPEETGLIQTLSPQITADILSGNTFTSLTYIYTTLNPKGSPAQTAEKLSPLVPQLSEYHDSTKYLHASIHTFLSQISGDSQNTSLLASEITAYKILNPNVSPSLANNFVSSQIESHGLKIPTGNTLDLANYISTFNLAARGDLLLEQSLTSEFVKSGISLSDAQAIAKEFIKTDIPLTTLRILQEGSPAQRSQILKELSLHSLNFLSTNSSLNKNAINILNQHFGNMKPEHFNRLQNIYQQYSPTSLEPGPLDAAQHNSLQFPSFLLKNPIASRLQNSATQTAVNKFFSTSFGSKIQQQLTKFGFKFGSQSTEKIVTQNLSPGLVSKLVSSLPFSGQQRFASISQIINKPLSALAQKIVSSAAVKALARAAAVIAVKIGLKVTEQAILQTLGSLVPGIGNLVAFLLSFVVDVVVKVVRKIAKFLRENIEIFIAGVLALGTFLITSSLALAAAVGGGALLFTPVGGAFISGVAGIITTLLATVVAVTVAPVVIVAIVVPITLAFFLYIITTSAYVVPNQTTVGVANCWPTDTGIITTLPPHGLNKTLDSFDIGGNDGATVYSTHAGTVIYTGWDLNGGTTGGYGNYVKIRSDQGFCTVYGHMTSGLQVSVGQTVTAGTPVGSVNSTGNSTGPHLHYEWQEPCSTYAGTNPGSTLITQHVPPGFALMTSIEYPGSCFASGKPSIP